MVRDWPTPVFNSDRHPGGIPHDSQDAGNHVRRIVTMWIEIETNTKQLQIPELDEPVEFNSNGSAQVTENVGALLVDKFDEITEKDNS